MSKKSNNNNAVALGCGTIFAVIAILALSFFLTPVFLMLTWNLAVCSLFSTLPAMTYWVAFGVNWFLSIVGNKFINTGISAKLDKIKDEISKN